MASTSVFGDSNAGLQAGIIHGPVSTTFHTHTTGPDRPETPPPPTIVIPFGRDRDFVQRDVVFDEVARLCAEPGSRVALVGLGGVGKSQIAIEYAYQVRDRSPETWVLWVHASNASRYEQSIRDIADCVRLPGRQDSGADIFQLLGSWLRSDKSGKWVMILDNVDEASFLLDASTDAPIGSGDDAHHASLRPAPLVSYLPRCPNGSILITSRTRHVALQLVEFRDIVAVEPMAEKDALSLLETKLGKLEEPEDDGIHAELASALEYMPLAIVQAASYIVQRAPRISPRQYLERLQKSDRARAGLLDFEGGQLRRDREAKNSILLTWQISFDHIRQSRPSATDLLSLMSFCDRQGIPESLLREFGSSGNGMPDDSSDDPSDPNYKDQADPDSDSESISSIGDPVGEDILKLQEYSFISIIGDGTTLEMHSLVQLSTRKWLQVQDQQERWKQEFISRVNAQLPTGEYENWKECQKYLPHAKAAAAQRPRSEASLREWASILYKAAWYLERMGIGKEAQMMAESAMKTRIQILGRGDKESVSAMTMVSNVYHSQGRWGDAEMLRVEVMESNKTRLGADHPHTLASIGDLASTLREQGRWDEAEKLEVEVMEGSKTKLGADHPDTLSSMGNLALIFRRQGRWEEAEKLGVEVMERSKTKLGADHPDTLIRIGNLASTLRKQGRWEEAEKLEVEVMERSKTKLGADHPDTLNSMGNLASILREQGRWDEAEKLEVEVTERRKAKLGADHPNTLSSMGNLASILREQGRWEEAEKLEVEMIERGKTRLGADHPDMLNIMSNLSVTLWKQGRWEEAERLRIKVTERSKTTLGADHPDTLTSIGNLASILWEQGRWKEAEKLDVEAMERRKSKLGADHPHTLTSMNNLARTWYDMGHRQRAIPLMKQCVEMRTRRLGNRHPDTISSADILSEWEADSSDGSEHS